MYNDQIAVSLHNKRVYWRICKNVCLNVSAHLWKESGIWEFTAKKVILIYNLQVI